MNKPILFVFFLFVVLSSSALSTPQIPDILIYEGKEYPIQTELLHHYFKKFPERNPKSEEHECSALWRGYRATFEVSKGRIYLKDVVIKVCWGPPISELKKVMPGSERLFVDWVSDLIDSGYGENTEDPYSLESRDAYEKYALFEVEKGQIQEARHFDNKGYRTFKKKQFEAFKKTTEYDSSLKRMLTDNPKMTQEDVDANILRSIFSYTKTFLTK